MIIKIPSGFLLSLLAMGFLSVGIPAGAQPDREAAMHLSGDALMAKAQRQGKVQVIVKLRADFVPEGRLAAPSVRSQRQLINSVQDGVLSRLVGHQTKTLARFHSVPALALELDAEALKKLKSDPNVVRVVEEAILYPTLDGTVPLIGGPPVHQAGHTGAGQVIAVLDTGVDANHPFFGGRVVSEACFSSGTESLCPSGDPIQIGPGAAAPCSDCDHGTHVAGIAAGNGSGLVGAAPGAQVMAVQVFSLNDSPDPDCPIIKDCDDSRPQGGGTLGATERDLMLGLEFVLDQSNSHQIASVNMSLGTDNGSSSPCDQLPFGDIVDNLRSVGIATVAASGNGSLPSALSWPACLSNVISVGATDDSDRVVGFSNSASFLDLLAPGKDVKSSVPGGGFADKSGTSMAAPHVAGAWAVMRQARPSLDVDDVLEALRSSGKPVPDSRNGLSFPRLQLNAAIVASDCRPPAFGDWLIKRDCDFGRSAVASANVIVSEGATLSIAADTFLDINLTRYHLKVESGSRVLVYAGGRIR